jgi:hypothetical protein
MKKGKISHLGAVLVALFVGAAVFASAAAAETPVFDADLSLTGGCTASPIDPVPDAGCPGGLHPSSSFSHPEAVATDSYGNIYVANFGKESQGGTEGRIDIFDSAGRFITELLDAAGPRALAVDSQGYLYVVNAADAERLVRYDPSASSYEPAKGEIAYESSPTVIDDVFGQYGVAVNPSNDHLFANYGFYVTEYGSAEEGNPAIDESIGQGELAASSGLGIAVDATHKRIYASDGNKIKVFELEGPHNRVLTVEGTPSGGPFHSELSVAVDEATGHFFVFDAPGTTVYEFDEAGNYLAAIKHSFQYVIAAEIAIDNGTNSPNRGYLYVPSHPSGVGHVFAFGPATECAPEIEAPSAGQLTQSEAVLSAEVKPCGLETTYSFQYTTRSSFEAEGFDSARVAGGGTLPPVSTFSNVSASVNGLDPGTEYVFRVLATNAKGPAEDEGAFTTFPGESGGGACPNEALRTGASALLPDCRAYELVTPPDTNAHTPHGVGRVGDLFATREGSPGGESISFRIEGGLIPGSNGTGAFFGDPYLAKRTSSGWSTSNAGPNGTESGALAPGSPSPDQRYSFWGTAGSEGTAAVPGSKEANYVRYPDGHSELVGRGSLATDPEAHGKLISEDGGHIIFVSGSNLNDSVQLEPEAPESGTQAIYDRTADEVTHVVSLLPGDETPKAGENANYVGASLDGLGIAFELGGTLYLRYNNEETFAIGGGVTFAGVAEGGNRIFYLEGGNLLRFDATNGEVKAFNASGTVIPVNVSADGSAAYFVSTSVLTSEANPNGVKAKAGQQNLYLSREGTISFVGIVTERDVEGEDINTDVIEGLGLWTNAVGPSPYGAPGRLGEDPSRTTPDGSVLLFESRANLTGYASEGHNQVYRYSATGELACLSCSPVGAPPTGSASLESIAQAFGDPEPFSAFAYVANLRSDGRRAFFQSTESLLPTDTDGLQDVYEWEAGGVGSCTSAAGCLYLISPGHSSKPDYLYAASDSGDDVFFVSSDVLLGVDSSETPSIYDARVNGGFAESAVSPCQGEGCRPNAVPAPALAPPALPALGSHDNSGHRCPKGKRKVRRHDKVRCVKKHHHRRHHRHKANSHEKGVGR